MEKKMEVLQRGYDMGSLKHRLQMNCGYDILTAV